METRGCFFFSSRVYSPSSSSLSNPPQTVPLRTRSLTPKATVTSVAHSSPTGNSRFSASRAALANKGMAARIHRHTPMILLRIYRSRYCSRRSFTMLLTPYSVSKGSLSRYPKAEVLPPL